ncbi:hypothetical protein LDENG_00150250 [Lucifuga dentata]|nr:hypothetical protein LDENG_00150250 [Lucifuga dentata]
MSNIKCWMSNNFLQLNDSKTEIIIITPAGLRNNNLNNNLISCQSWAPYVKKEACNLCVIFDTNPSFSAQVTKTMQTVSFRSGRSPRLSLFFLLQTYRKLFTLSLTLGWTIAMHFMLLSAKETSTAFS